MYRSRPRLRRGLIKHCSLKYEIEKYPVDGYHEQKADKDGVINYEFNVAVCIYCVAVHLFFEVIICI